jgi:hypothetical protein
MILSCRLTPAKYSSPTTPESRNARASPMTAGALQLWRLQICGFVEVLIWHPDCLLGVYIDRPKKKSLMGQFGENMNRTAIPWYRTPNGRSLIRRSAVALLVLTIWWTARAIAQNPSQSPNSTEAFSVRATHLLGFEGTPANANGTLSIQNDGLQFQKDGKPAAQVKIPSVKDVFLGEANKQVGGTAMTVGKAAAPFGGGRAISLFAHKKYDTVALEYVDANGALHGAIFQLDKGQAEIFKNQLVAKGAHLSEGNDQPAQQSKTEVK